MLDDIGYMTCMTLVLLGNYAQTGHLGGPLAYTPDNVAAHLDHWKKRISSRQEGSWGTRSTRNDRDDATTGWL